MGAQQQGADATHGRWLVIPRTLSFVFNGADVLLMKRAAHKRVFPNQYNGLGGHLERDEDPYYGAIREIHEESGLTVRDVRLRAIHHIDAKQSTGIILFIFTAISDQREILSHSDEGKLEWIPITSLERYDLVEDLPLILPRLVAMADDAPPWLAHISYNDADQIQIRYADK